MSHTLPEFRFFYFTNIYDETIAFYRDQLGWEIMRSWDRPDDKGTIFKSPNGSGLIEIENGSEKPTLIGGGLYIQVENVDEWYELALQKNIKIVTPLSDTSYGHRNFKIEDPNGLVIALFKYN